MFAYSHRSLIKSMWGWGWTCMEQGRPCKNWEQASQCTSLNHFDFGVKVFHFPVLSHPLWLIEIFNLLDSPSLLFWKLNCTESSLSDCSFSDDPTFSHFWKRKQWEFPQDFTHISSPWKLFTCLQVLPSEPTGFFRVLVLNLQRTARHLQLVVTVSKGASL